MIEVSRLCKEFGNVKAVQDVTFTVQPGRVVGFLGPNGAGKSTVMRCLTGLVRPTSGHARLFGVDFAQLPNPGRAVGVLLDAGAQHKGRSGYAVLSLGATLIGAPPTRVGEILDMVGLTVQEARRPVGGYSLGMRQRLGIGHALLGRPRVLILDEPANGLDPGGIRWMRELLRGFADDGGSVLLSSHLLQEIEHVADELVVIGRGRVVAQGTKQELLAAGGTSVRPVDPELLGALEAALAAAGRRVERDDDSALRVDADPALVGRLAQEAGVALAGLSPAAGSLEDLFLQLTADTSREAGERPRPPTRTGRRGRG